MDQREWARYEKVPVFHCCIHADPANGFPLWDIRASCPGDPLSGYDVSYGYDSGTNGKGRRTSMGVSGGDYSAWTYDARGRVESEAKQIPGGGQFVTSFTYNSADLPKTMTYPDTNNEVVTFEYNNR